MKSSYFFYGRVLPERAKIASQFGLGFTHMGTDVSGEAHINILENKIEARVEGDDTWNIFDLRNVVKTILQNHLAMVGYLKGYAYEVDVERVVHEARGIDYIFGVEIPCLEERGKTVDLNKEVLILRKKTLGLNGVFIHRCLNDLIATMKYADDTGFYCYRAVESLRQHCAVSNGVDLDNRTAQWEKLREVSGCSEKDIRALADAAKNLRHGGVSYVTSEERARLFTLTWDVVGSYLDQV